MIKKFYDKLLYFIKEEYKFIIFMVIFYLLLSFPVNYYIITGGGISDIDTRIKVDDAYSSKGSFNISYVTELKGTISTYLFSYIIPDWKRVGISEYKYDEKEDYDDLEFRSNLELDSANDNAIKIAYKLANKKYKVIDTKIYVTGTFSTFKTNLSIKDQILAIDGNSYDSVDKYKEYLQTANDSVLVRVKRDGIEKNIKCKLYDLDGSKVLGVILGVVNKYKTDPKIKIKFKDSESGPSGGLITTLDIYNKLTKKDLTNSLKIAGTGTISEDGSIGEIGEVKYKLLGAVKNKAQVFLVPNGRNYKTCVDLKKKRKLKIKIIGVSTIEEAIKELEKLDS